MIIFLFQKNERQQHQKTHSKQNDNGDDMKGKVLIVEGDSFLQLESANENCHTITVGRKYMNNRFLGCKCLNNVLRGSRK